jgi:hypothetical protein
MNTRPRSIVFAAAALAGLPMALVLVAPACNVQGSSPDLAADAGTTMMMQAPSDDSTTTPEDDSSMESDDATTPSGEASTDAGAKDGEAKDGGDSGASTCVVPDGGMACTPHSVACGSTPCTTPTDVCCANGFTMGVPTTGTCQASTTCGLGSTEVACEEAADCPSGQLCCETPPTLGGGPGTQTCSGACPAPSYQLCRSNTECSGGAHCVPQSCPNGLSPYDVEACGLQSGCTAL